MSYRDFGLVIDQTQAAATPADQPALDMVNLAGFSIQTEWSGTVVGTLALQERNQASLTWRNVLDVVFTQPAGAPGGQVINVSGARSRYYRVTASGVSGTGTLKVAVYAKNG